MIIDALATEPHFVHHLAPVWHALDIEERGTFLLPKHLAHLRPDLALAGSGVPADLVMVASAGDRRRALAYENTSDRIVYFEHGVGISYSDAAPSYAGGSPRDGVVLFCSPNSYVTRRNRARHPHIPERIIGSPRLDALARIPRLADIDQRPVISWHWDCRKYPESRTAFRHYRPGLDELVGRFPTLAGHAHPRAWPLVERAYRKRGIPKVRQFTDVIAQASVYAIDNSSTMYEACALGIPIVTMNAPWYRRHVQHGLRFWQHVPGVEVYKPEELADAFELADAPETMAWNREVADAVYPPETRGVAARLAVEAMREIA